MTGQVSTEVRKCHKCKQTGHLIWDCPQKEIAVSKEMPPASKEKTASKEKSSQRAVKCYNCGQLCHIATSLYIVLK